MFAVTQATRRHSTKSGSLPSTSSYGESSSCNGYGYVPVVKDSPLRSPLIYSASSGASDDAYYKDKPRKDPSPNVLSHTLVAVMGFLLLVWTMHSRAQRAWLLRELQVQSFHEAVNVFKELKEEHLEAFDELEYHYSRNEKLEQRDFAWKQQMELLQNSTQRESWRAVMDK